MKWKIVASPTKGQSRERQSSQAAAIASGKLKRVANLALDNRARVQPTGRGASEPSPSDPCLWLANRSSILQCVDDRLRLRTNDPQSIERSEHLGLSDGCNVWTRRAVPSACGHGSGAVRQRSHEGGPRRRGGPRDRWSD